MRRRNVGGLTSQSDYGWQLTRILWLLQEYFPVWLLGLFAIAILRPDQDGIVPVLLVGLPTGIIIAFFVPTNWFPALGVAMDKLERGASWLSQLEVPSPRGSEEVRRSAVAWTDEVWPKHGRLTLTTKHLIFQRPRYRFWPGGRGEEHELWLADMVAVRYIPMGLRPLGSGAPLLEIEMIGELFFRFRSYNAYAWRQEIRRAIRELRTVST